jgi:hypothetical protein
MKREMSIEWGTGDETKITIENDDEGILWLTFQGGESDKVYRRAIEDKDIIKLSRFFYDASDFIKRDS